jgi:hypothetical protein
MMEKSALAGEGHEKISISPLDVRYSTYCTHLYIFFSLRSPCREDLQTVKENGTGRETEIR